jgi:hypothetical protein
MAIVMRNCNNVSTQLAGGVMLETLTVFVSGKEVGPFFEIIFTIAPLDPVSETLSFTSKMGLNTHFVFPSV